MAARMMPAVMAGSGRLCSGVGHRGIRVGRCSRIGCRLPRRRSGRPRGHGGQGEAKQSGCRNTGKSCCACRHIDSFRRGMRGRYARLAHRQRCAGTRVPIVPFCCVAARGGA
jgi:hypothetical protein